MTKFCLVFSFKEANPPIPFAKGDNGLLGEFGERGRPYIGFRCLSGRIGAKTGRRGGVSCIGVPYMVSDTTGSDCGAP